MSILYVKKSNSVSKSPSGPDFDLETNLEPSQRGGIGPGVAADNPADSRDVDPGSSGNLSHPDFLCDRTEAEGELAGGLDYGVLADPVGPALASVPGCGSGVSPHISTVPESSPPTLVSIDSGGTLSSADVAWNQQREVIDELIENYKPKKMPAANWDAIRDAVQEIVRKALPPTVYASYNTYAGVAYMAEWAWMRGQSLDPEELLDPANIDRYVDQCHSLGKASKATRRSILRSVHRKYLGTARIGRKSFFPKADNPMAPYTDDEMDEFIFWSENQRSEVNTRGARAMLGLSGGAGLASEDIITVKVGGVRRSKGLMVVTVGGNRPREVPVRPGFEHFIVAAKDGLPKTSMLFLPNRTRSARSKAGNFIKESTGDNKPTFQRLRVTWLIYWLEKGVPLPALIKAFGVQELHSISRYTKFLSKPTKADVLNTFRDFS